MIVTNKYNISYPLYAALKYGGRYDGDTVGADVSVTTLGDSPKIWKLKKQFEDRIHIDVTEMLWAILGNAVHFFIENAKLADPTRFIIEKRMFMEINGLKVSGKMDVLDLLGASGILQNNEFIITGGTLNDWKVSSVWAHIFQSEKISWQQQVNYYASMLRNVGFILSNDEKILGQAIPKGTRVRIYPEQATVTLIMRDWQRKDAQFKPDYPQIQVSTIPIILYEDEAVVNSMSEKSKLFLRVINGEEIDCSPKDMWHKGTTYAVIPSIGGRAYSGGLFSTTDKDEASMPARQRASLFALTLNGQGKTTFIEERLGDYTRCTSYCPVREFCQQRINLGIVIN